MLSKYFSLVSLNRFPLVHMTWQFRRSNKNRSTQLSIVAHSQDDPDSEDSYLLLTKEFSSHHQWMDLLLHKGLHHFQYSSTTGQLWLHLWSSHQCRQLRGVGKSDFTFLGYHFLLALKLVRLPGRFRQPIWSIIPNHPQHLFHLFTDASYEACGAHLNYALASGQWDSVWRTLHINLLEMEAVCHALVHWSVTASSVMEATDNSTVYRCSGCLHQQGIRHTFDLPCWNS